MPVPWGPPDSVDLLYHPERCRPLAPGELWSIIDTSGHDLVSWAVALDQVVKRRAFVSLGYAHPDAFIRGFLAIEPSELRRIVRLGLLARDAFASNEVLATDPPTGLLRSLLRIRSKRHWATVVTTLLLDLVGLGRVSPTQAKKAALAAKRRAHRLKVERRKGWRPRSRKRASRWWVQTRDGHRIEVVGSNVVG